MKACLATVLLLLPLIVCAQNDLDEKKGFQDIALGSDPKGYQGIILKKTTKDENFKKNSRDINIPEIDLYQAKGGYYQDVAGIKIHKFIVKAFDNRIYEIEITAEKDPDFYKGLESRYGPGNYSMPTNSYIWSGKEVRLSFKSESKKKVKLTYFLFAVNEWIKEKEKENAKSIADDF